MATLVVISGADAECRMRCRLDKRKRYALYRRKVHEMIRWTDVCYGCSEFTDYMVRVGPFGCAECGYTGKRRRAEWVPVIAYPTRNRREFSSTKSRRLSNG